MNFWCKVFLRFYKLFKRFQNVKYVNKLIVFYKKTRMSYFIEEVWTFIKVIIIYIIVPPLWTSVVKFLHTLIKEIVYNWLIPRYNLIKVDWYIQKHTGFLKLQLFVIEYIIFHFVSWKSYRNRHSRIMIKMNEDYFMNGHFHKVQNLMIDDIVVNFIKDVYAGPYYLFHIHLYKNDSIEERKKNLANLTKNCRDTFYGGTVATFAILSSYIMFTIPMIYFIFCTVFLLLYYFFITTGITLFILILYSPFLLPMHASFTHYTL